MIYQFLLEEDLKNIGDCVECIINRYSQSLKHPEWMKKCHIVMKVMNGVYGSVYEIQIPNRDPITLDSRMFGRAIILDGNSTVEHWNGSAILYDKNGNQMGTGFSEQSEFAPHDTVVLQRIEGAGLTKNDLAEFTGGEINIWQAIPSIYTFFYIVFLAIFLIAITGKLSVHSLRKKD